jgi:hypothetical protein
VQRADSRPPPADDLAANILHFAPPQPGDSGASTALDLVYQAAEVFTGMEVHARETEARARSLCQSAVERLQLAEQRVEAAERARRDIIHDVDGKLQEASRALQQAQSRFESAEHHAAAAEARALAAETEAREARRVLAQVEEAIRSRLLGESLAAFEPLHAVA